MARKAVKSKTAPTTTRTGQVDRKAGSLRVEQD